MTATVSQRLSLENDLMINGEWWVKSIHHYGIRSFSKLDLCEGRSFSPTIFKTDIELSVYHISCSVFPFVALSKATFANNLHIVFSSPY